MPPSTLRFDTISASGPSTWRTWRITSRLFSPKNGLSSCPLPPPMSAVTRTMRSSGISVFDKTPSCGRWCRRKRDKGARRTGDTSSTGALPCDSWRSSAACVSRSKVSARPGSRPPLVVSACASTRSSLTSRPITRSSPSPGNHCCVMARPSERRVSAISSWMSGWPPVAAASAARRGPCSDSVSMMVRISRIGTSSASRPCSTFCSAVSDSVLGTRSSTSLGESRPMRSSNCCTSWRPSRLEPWRCIRWFRWVATTVPASTTV